jgi:uracil-DNA glycosylase family 4
MGKLGDLGRRVPDCARCPRLVAYRAQNRARFPGYWNRPVPAFGDPRAPLVILGLAPGLHGANRSGRPFWLDASGEWLYGELERRRLWNGKRLRGALILNAVKCAPPQNRPTARELATCREWLVQELEALAAARVIVTLGALAHGSLLRVWGVRPLSAAPFRHGALYRLPGRPVLLASYHPSRQNTNTGVLTRRMWSRIFGRALRLAEAGQQARSARSERSERRR